MKNYIGIDISKASIAVCDRKKVIKWLGWKNQTDLSSPAKTEQRTLILK